MTVRESISKFLASDIYTRTAIAADRVSPGLILLALETLLDRSLHSASVEKWSKGKTT